MINALITHENRARIAVEAEGPAPTEEFLEVIEAAVDTDLELMQCRKVQGPSTSTRETKARNGATIRSSTVLVANWAYNKGTREEDCREYGPVSY
jgi:hypothetical protein